MDATKKIHIGLLTSRSADRPHFDGLTHGFGARSIRLITCFVLTLILVVGCLVEPTVGLAQAPADGQGKVKIEWLGHEFYRLTSPKGVVVITSPWLGNPDGPARAAGKPGSH